MITVVLNEEMRTKILEYDINNSENTCERDLWYIQSSEKEVLHSCICSWGEYLEEIGFKKEDWELLMNNNLGFKIKFGNIENENGYTIIFGME